VEPAVFLVGQGEQWRRKCRRDRADKSALVEDLQSPLPDSVRIILKLLVDTFTALEAQVAVLDAEINQRIRPDGTPVDDDTERGANCLDGNHRARASG